MIPYGTYKLVHFFGIFLLFLSMGGVMAARKEAGGVAARRSHRALAITHGIGLLLALTGGFGLLARLGIVHGQLPGWVLAKLGILVAFGGLLAVSIYRPAWSGKLGWSALALGICAAWLAANKPF